MIILAWSNSTTAQTAVAIERSINDVTFVQVATVGGSATGFQDQGLFPSSTYYYRIRALNGSSASPYTPVVPATTATPTWQQVNPGLPAPTARLNMGFTNAFNTNQMMVCAGDDGSSSPPTNTQTWALDYSGSPKWTQVGTGGSPGVRFNPGVSYSPGSQTFTGASNAVILFGGYDGTPVLRNDVWTLKPASPSAWAGPVVTAGTAPAGRLGSAVVMVGSKLFVIGGQTVAGFMNDLWILDFGSPTPFWTNPLVTSPMDPRAFHTAVFDPVNNQIVVFGGFDGANYRNDTWALNLTGAPFWSLLTPTGIPPAARSNMTAVYNSAAQMMIVFGGNAVSGSENDVWLLTLSGTPIWSPVLVDVFPSGTAPPGTRGSHAAIFDDAGSKMIIFGGQDFFSGIPYSDTWQLQF
ncbi:MAG TPA: kelch repeat-containing protein [Planctomycetota bacterium]|nr:kelch repeat-containing protein [Planctomycetota bacterium]